MYVAVKNKKGTQKQRKVWVINSNTYFAQAQNLVLDARNNCRVINITAGGTFHKEHSIFYKVYANYNYILVEHVLAGKVFKSEIIACDYSELQLREFFYKVLTTFKFKGDRHDNLKFGNSKLEKILTEFRARTLQQP
jgi:hypothetical protein